MTALIERPSKGRHSGQAYSCRVLKRLPGGSAAVVVTLVTLGLVLVDLTDGVVRRWWLDHAFVTATVAGLLVLLITVLVADEVVNRRQIKERSRAIAAQAAIVMGQAARSSKAVVSMLQDGGERDTASDEVRTYMQMLLIAAPVLIDSQVARTFLEAAQHLGGELARALAGRDDTAASTTVSRTRLDDAVDRLRAASTPLLQVLNVEQRAAAGGEDDQGTSAESFPG